MKNASLGKLSVPTSKGLPHGFLGNVFSKHVEFCTLWARPVGSPLIGPGIYNIYIYTIRCILDIR